MLQQPKLSPCRRQYTVTDLLITRARATNDRLLLQHDKGSDYIRATKVFNSYIAVLPPGNTAKEPNPWIIVLDIGDQTTIKIGLRQVDSLGNTIVVYSAGPQIHTDGSLEGCSRSWSIAVQGGSIIAD
ncbi:hypothetical protein M431DRAFT_22004 [Trichoderma harzianum CBS 226.95]|uniref:Uncharacterized protein n=1 Tax=Trichoderma harzianum CBS 226.95 TaxID=983964 RepID=A0A2T3ZRE4_TRIHA|nr:hypothetical protein M431DRAFT_22004 [Trichoderma harzianum CBS 226.95]PTB47374.1 hypothetical protein M431DRAFT_22004 [Trichoderma harzianum CBS 226.95]